MVTDSGISPEGPKLSLREVIFELDGRFREVWRTRPVVRVRVKRSLSRNLAVFSLELFEGNQNQKRASNWLFGPRDYRLDNMLQRLSGFNKKALGFKDA